MSHTPHDALFKAVFEAPAHTAALLGVVLPSELCRAIAWSTLAPKGATIVDTRLGQHHNDLLFSARCAEVEGSVLVLLEHQSSVKEAMAHRVLSYLTRIWGSCKGPPYPPILALVLSHQEGGWTAPVEMRELVAPGPDLIPGLGEFLPSFSVRVVDLFKLNNDDLMGASLPPVPKLALWLLRDARNRDRLLANLPHWLPVFASVHASQGGADALSQLFHYIILVVDEATFQLIYDEVLAHLPQTKDTLMTAAEALHIKGHKQGLEEGRHEGLEEGLRAIRAMLVKQLELRFGALEAEHRHRLAEAKLAELERLGHALVYAPSAAALFSASSAA